MHIHPSVTRQRQAMDSLLADWKLTVLPFFSSKFIFLDYADSSNQHDFQRDFLPVGSRALRICPIKSVEWA